MLWRVQLVALASAAACSGALAATPPQLRNKSITVDTTLQAMQRAPDGRIATPQIETQHVIYVSSAGRAFVRATRRIDNRYFSGGRTTDTGPGQNSTGTEAREVRFENGKLVGSFAFVSGAARAVVSFDSAFATCSATVVFGRAGNAPIKWRGLDGVLYELQQVRVARQTCAIRDGNPFAK